jgi:hypothetical protein
MKQCSNNKSIITGDNTFEDFVRFANKNDLMRRPAKEVIYAYIGIRKAINKNVK